MLSVLILVTLHLCAASRNSVVTSTEHGLNVYLPPAPAKAFFGMAYVNPQRPVMSSPINVYVIWYGDWNGLQPSGMMTDLISGLGQSDYWKILATEYDSPPGSFVSSTIYHGGEYFIRPCSVYYAQWGAGTIVNDALTRGVVPADANGIYLVIGAPGVDGGGYHGGNTIFCSSPPVGVDTDCLLHELVETAVQSAWETNVSIGQWENADVCDGFVKTLPSGRTIGGTVNVTFGNLTLETGQYIFDLVAQECEVSAWSTKKTPPKLPKLDPLPFAHRLGTLNCGPLEPAWSDGSQSGGVAAAAIVAVSIAGLAFVAAFQPALDRGWTRVLHLAMSATTLLASVITSATLNSSFPAISPPNDFSWSQQSDKTWAISFSLYDVAHEGSVLSPLREVTTDHSVAVATSAVLLGLAVKGAFEASPASDALSTIVASLLVGVISLPAGENAASTAVLVPACIAALSAAAELPEIFGIHRAPAVAISVLSLTVGILALVKRGDEMSTSLYNLNVNDFGTPDISAVCSLTASCGFYQSSGLSYIPYFDTNPKRFGVVLRDAYVPLGSLAIVNSVLWVLVAIHDPPYLVVSAVITQCVTFGLWIPMIGPTSHHHAAPASIVRVASALGCSFGVDTPSSVTSITALASTIFALALLSTGWSFFRTESLDKFSERTIQWLLSLATAVIAAVVASFDDPPHASPSLEYRVKKIYDSHVTTGTDWVAQVFDPLYETANTATLVATLAAISVTLSISNVWQPVVLFATFAALGAAIPSSSPSLIAPSAAAAAFSAYICRKDNSWAVGNLFWALAICFDVAVTICMIVGIARGEQIVLTVLPEGNQGTFSSRLLLST